MNENIHYKQWNEFISHLSIIDLLLFEEKEKINSILNDYVLI